MTNRLDIAVDLETLSTKSNPVITQIAAVVFDIKTGKIIRKFNALVDPQSGIDDGFDVQWSTIKWWMKQSADAKKAALTDDKTFPIKNVLLDFQEWIKQIANLEGVGARNIFLWGNGIIADNVWLQSGYEKYKIKDIIHYRNHRDVRTILELAAHKLNTTGGKIRATIDHDGVHHDALSDAIWASKLVCKCHSSLM